MYVLCLPLHSLQVGDEDDSGVQVQENAAAVGMEHALVTDLQCC